MDYALYKVGSEDELWDYARLKEYMDNMVEHNPDKEPAHINSGMTFHQLSWMLQQVNIDNSPPVYIIHRPYMTSEDLYPCFDVLCIDTNRLDKLLPFLQWCFVMGGEELVYVSTVDGKNMFGVWWD